MRRFAHSRSRSSAFILFEVMIAVAFFVIGVLVLGECVKNCVEVEIDKQSEARIRRVLENRMAELQAGAIPLSDSTTEELKGMFEGLTLTTTREPLERENEKGLKLAGLFLVKTEVSWVKTGGEKDSRAIEFYVFQRQR